MIRSACQCAWQPGSKMEIEQTRPRQSSSYTPRKVWISSAYFRCAFECADAWVKLSKVDRTAKPQGLHWASVTAIHKAFRSHTLWRWNHRAWRCIFYIRILGCNAPQHSVAELLHRWLSNKTLHRGVWRSQIRRTYWFYTTRCRHIHIFAPRSSLCHLSLETGTHSGELTCFSHVQAYMIVAWHEMYSLKVWLECRNYSSDRIIMLRCWRRASRLPLLHEAVSDCVITRPWVVFAGWYDKFAVVVR